MPGREAGAGTDDGLVADVNQVLVVDGALGEEQAGPGAHLPEAAPARIVGADRPQLGGPVPGRMHQS